MLTAVLLIYIRQPSETVEDSEVVEEDNKNYLKNKNRTANLSNAVQIHGDFLILYNYLPAKVGGNSEILAANDSSHYFDNRKTVTVAFHCTVDFIDLLPNRVETWAGPVSLAIYFPFLNASIAEAIQDLYIFHECQTTIAHRVSVHLVFPKFAQRNLG